MSDNKEQALIDRINKAISYVNGVDLVKAEVGKYVIDDDSYYLVQEYNSKMRENCRLEAHKKYVDVQWIVSGEEELDIVAPEGLEVSEEYNGDKDVVFYKAPVLMQKIILRSGSYMVILPEMAHMPGCAVNESVAVKKVVIKVRA